MGAVLAALVMVLAACGGGGGDTGGGGGAAEADPADRDPEGVIRLGYDLVAGVRGGITWDPTEVTTQLTDNGLFYLVYGSLLRVTPEGEMVPDLAESTEVVDEDTIEVTLREGLTFSDGEPLVAETVRASLERNLAATDSVGFGTAFFDLESIEVTSPTSLTLTIPNGTAASWHDTFLASWETAVMHPDADFEHPVGAGPMTVTEFVPEQSIVLEKNPDYWDAESILVGGFELVHVPDPRSGSSALNAGQVDVAGLDTSQIPAVGEDHILIEPDPNMLMTFMLCKRDEPLSDPQVRRALNMAVDRQALSDAVFDGAFLPALGLWPEGHRFHDPAVEEAIAYDPEGARELLADAGYEDGFEFDLYVLESGGMPEVAEVVQQMYAEVGVTVNVNVTPDFVPEFLVQQAPGAGGVPTMSPNRLKLLQWSGQSIGNTCRYQDPELEALADELSLVSDTSDEAAEVWHRVEELAVAEDALSVFLLFGSTVTGYSDRLGDPAVMPYPIPVPDVRQTFVVAGS